MAQARAKASPTDHYAKRIAAALARGTIPLPTPDLDSYLDNASGEIFTALDGFVRHIGPDGKNDPLALGYLYLVQGLLEHLRFRTDRGYEEAAQRIAEFQRRLADLAAAGRIDGRALALVAGTLHQAKIAASPELAAATAQADFTAAGDLPQDISAALAAVVDTCQGDPFLVVGSLAEAGHAMPAETRATLTAALAQSDNAGARDASVLFLLDPDPTVRRAVAAALEAVAAKLSPDSVRRLIAVRNWRPDDERLLVDAVVRAARGAGIECAQWGTGSAEFMLASAIDGSGAQGFLIVSPAGRRKRMSSLLVKNGLRDAWSGEPESRRQTEATLAAVAVEQPMMPVSRAYLDRVVCHHLAIGLAQGVLPPPGLLQVAETLGGAEWQPAPADWREVLATLIADTPNTMRTPKAVSDTLMNSAGWADLGGITESWFEDDQEVARRVAGTRRGQRAKMADILLQTVIARRREKWAEHFVWTALWLREAPADADASWREFAILAQALADGRDMAEMTVMRDMAMRTVAVLTDASRQAG
jgi:hypothetical protein